MKIAVILPAAGVGKRFAAAATTGAEPATLSKIEMNLAGKPVFLRAIELFLNRPIVGQIILAVNPDSVDDFRFRWGDKLAFHNVDVVAGGKAERWETVLKALDAVRADCTHAAIHDAARPLTSASLIDRIFETAAKHAAVIPGLNVAATLKRVADDVASEEEADPLDAILGGGGKTTIKVRRVVETVDRSDLVEVQTPQVFELALLRRAYEQITSGKLSDRRAITDDAGLVERMGERVYVVDGESINLKITRPDDMKLAEAFLTGHERIEATKSARKRLFNDLDDAD